MNAATERREGATRVERAAKRAPANERAGGTGGAKPPGEK
jgi:hypothetical protein